MYLLCEIEALINILPCFFGIADDEGRERSDVQFLTELERVSDLVSPVAGAAFTKHLEDFFRAAFNAKIKLNQS